MLNRRTLFPALAGLGTAAAALFSSRDAKAAKPSFQGDLDPRGTVGRLERLPTLDLESQQDFLTGFRTVPVAVSDLLGLSAWRPCLRQRG